MGSPDAAQEAALARLAVERGLLDAPTARGALERASRQRTTLIEALRSGGRLDARLEREMRAAFEHLTGRRTARLLVPSQSLGPSPGSVPPLAPPPPVATRRRLAPGDRIAGHTVEKILGHGAMGAVFVGRSDAGARHAIKVPFLAPGDDLDRARFEREAQTLARLKPHRHVVRVHSAGLEGDDLYCVLELIEGESLDKVVARGVVPWPRALEIALHLARGLEHVHAAGIFHRDVKPANVLVRAEDGSAVLTDFGLARDETRERLTQTGVMVGTPLYMPPEQVRNAHPADARSDVYALGATLYHLLTGRVPLPATTVEDLMRKLARERPVPPSELVPGLPPAVDAVVLRALEKVPADRYPTAEAFAQDLALAREGAAVSAKRAGHGRQLARDVARDPRRAIKLLLLIACALALANLVLLTRWALRDAPPPPEPDARAPKDPSPERRRAAWRKAVLDATQDLEPARRALDSTRLGLLPPPAAPESGGRVAPVPSAALVAAFARLEATITLQAPSPDEGEVARAELAAVRGSVLAELATVEILATLGAGETDSAESLLRRALDGRPAHDRPAAELALAGLRLGLARHSPELLHAVLRSPALRRLNLAPLDSLTTTGPLALAFLDVLEKRLLLVENQSPEARRAVAIVRARAFGSLEPAELRAERKAARLFFEHELSVEHEVVGDALVAFLDAARTGAAGETEDLILDFKREGRLALARELAAADTRDPDALGLLELPPTLTPAFMKLAREAYEARDPDVAGHVVTQALRSSPTASVDSDFLWTDLQRGLHERIEDGDWDRAIALSIAAIRAGYTLSWPATQQPPGLVDKLRRILAGRRDWAVTFFLASVLEVDATRGPGGVDSAVEMEAIDLAQKVALDPRVPRIVRSRARVLMGDAYAQLVRPIESARSYMLAHDDSPYPGQIASHVSAELLDTWVMTGRKDEATLDAAIDWGRRAIDESQAVLDASRGNATLPLSPGGIPSYRLTPSEEDEEPYERCQTALVDALIAAGRLDEAERALERPTPPRWALAIYSLRLLRLRFLLGKGQLSLAKALLDETFATKDGAEPRAEMVKHLRRIVLRVEGWGLADAATWLRDETTRLEGSRK